MEQCVLEPPNPWVIHYNWAWGSMAGEVVLGRGGWQVGHPHPSGTHSNWRYSPPFAATPMGFLLEDTYHTLL